MPTYCARVAASLPVMVILLAVAANAAWPTGSALVNRGREISTFRCSACHQVTSFQEPPKAVYDPGHWQNVPAPSFAEIARMDGSKPRFLREFIVAPSHPMREHRFAPEDVAAIVAYIQSLRSNANGKPR